MYELIKKAIFNMIRNKRKGIFLYDIDGKNTLFKYENTIAKTQKYTDSLVPEDYEYRDELLALGQDLDVLKASLESSLESKKDVFFSFILFTLICKHYYDTDDLDGLKSCSELITGDELEVSVLYFVYYGSLYATKDVYLDSISRKNLEAKMYNSVVLFKDLGMEFTEEDLANYYDYLESEYTRLVRI